MSIITLILAALVALEHFYIMYLETFATQSKATARVFNMSEEELQRESVTNLFKNQGIYNGLIAVFLLYGIFTGNATVVVIFLLNVVLAALYGSVTADRKIIIKQCGLAILALLTFLF
jgi:putative membrane protein